MARVDGEGELFCRCGYCDEALIENTPVGRCLNVSMPYFTTILISYTNVRGVLEFIPVYYFASLYNSIPRPSCYFC